MTQTTKPSKEDVREWFERRTHAARPAAKP
jgi:hypothetical protein